MQHIDTLSTRNDPTRAMSLQSLCCQSLHQGCNALAGLVQARSMALHLSDLSAGLGGALAQVGVVIATDDAPELPDAAQAVLSMPCVLPARAGMPTDCVDLVLRLAGPTDSTFGVLVLRNVPQGWDSQAKRDATAALVRLLQMQSCALLAPATLIADPVLTLIERLQDVDDRAASHLLMGILRLLAGRSPSSVEATALRIAGLSDMPASQPAAPDVILNADGARLLAGLAVIDPLSTPCAQAAALELVDDTTTPPAAPAQGLAAFARLHLMKQDFDVADDPDTSALWFRATDTQTWLPLQGRTGDGWNVIATEIIEKTTDILRAFTQMHLIRRRDIDTDEVAEIYDLHGRVWWLRSDETGVQARRDDGDWIACDVADDITGKARAVEALMQIDPDMATNFGEHARDWAGRMAHCVQVTPVMVQAAE
jgi:hypothetical protein